MTLGFAPAFFIAIRNEIFRSPRGFTPREPREFRKRGDRLVAESNSSAIRPRLEESRRDFGDIIESRNPGRDPLQESGSPSAKIRPFGASGKYLLP